jgi:branched-chain amino acid transport system substrate-binding protein
MGSIACTEAQACHDAERVFTERAAKFGFDYVSKSKASLAQPDFTAECLSARNAGVETLIIVMDTNSIGRISASCARQGFKPNYSVAHSTATDAHKSDPNLDGMVTASVVFPYFQADTPAAQEFQDAKRRFGGDLPMGIALATGWVSGKLLERAARELPEPPTSAAILKGLYSLKGDTLDGLAMPLTFTEGKPPAPQACWFNMRIRDKAWVSPDGFKLNCLPS